MRLVKPALLVVLVTGCIGSIDPVVPEDAPDGGAPPPPEQPTYKVTGMVRDYEGADILGNVALTTIGMEPAVSANSNELGAYELVVPPGSAFYVSVMPAGTTYRPTINHAVSVVGGDIVEDMKAVTSVYAQRQHATVGLAVVPGTSIVIAELVTEDGLPWEGILKAELTLEPLGGGAPVGDGPCFLGVNGDVDPAIPASVVNAGVARAAFVNVPAGEFTLYVRRAAAAPGPDGGLLPDAGLGPDAAPADPGLAVEQAATPVMSLPDAALNGATLVWVQQLPGTGDPGGPPPTGPYYFDPDIYPMFMRASQGGQGCASCHTAGGTAGLVLILDDGADAVHARLLAGLGYVNLLSPVDSLLLSKPLYEDPPNHPNATWIDMNDPAYVKIMMWIEQGAPLRQ